MRAKTILSPKSAEDTNKIFSPKSAEDINKILDNFADIFREKEDKITPESIEFQVTSTISGTLKINYRIRGYKPRWSALFRGGAARDDTDESIANMVVNYLNTLAAKEKIAASANKKFYKVKKIHKITVRLLEMNMPTRYAHKIYDIMTAKIEPK